MFSYILCYVRADKHDTFIIWLKCSEEEAIVEVYIIKEMNRNKSCVVIFFENDNNPRINK